MCKNCDIGWIGKPRTYILAKISKLKNANFSICENKYNYSKYSFIVNVKFIVGKVGEILNCKDSKRTIHLTVVVS